MRGAAGDQEGAGVVSQVWEGVSRMTALAKQTTQAFLEGSVVLGEPLPGTSAIERLHRTMGYEKMPFAIPVACVYMCVAAHAHSKSCIRLC